LQGNAIFSKARYQAKAVFSSSAFSAQIHSPAMTASKAIAVMADSEYIASNSCYRNLTMTLPVFFLVRIQGEQEKN
jgi:hypothetical protein